MKKTEKLKVLFHGRPVGVLSLTPDNRLNVFEYDKSWLADGLMCISLREPFMDYSNLLALTGYITQSREDVEQMYRRMLFNYLTDNKDDHCKNFSFYVVRDNDLKTWRWRLAPAYDLTLCTEGYNGEHATSVNGTGQPRLSDFIAVGNKIKLSEDRCRELIEEVRSGCMELSRYDIKE